MRGRAEPRIWTPPLRELTRETSFGYDVIDFADAVLGMPLDPWQQWLVIHAGEMLDDGRPRFRIVHVMVARQNGKTHLPVILALYWQVVVNVPMILGTSTKVDYAKESWLKSIRVAEHAPGLTDIVPKKRREWTRHGSGEQESRLNPDPDDPTMVDSRYKISAANEEGGRSLTIDRLILDELRQHHDYSAWDAAVPAGNAVRDFQVWALSNAGSDKSIVLNDERASAIAFIETGEGDPRTGWFEWSAPPNADPLDISALAQANPNLGYRIDPEALLADARKAIHAGGAKLAGFRTENMCQAVTVDDPVIPPEKWRAIADPESQITGRVAFAVEVALNGSSSAIAVAGYRADGIIHGEIVDEREGSTWVPARLAELADKWSPVMVALDPSSPAGQLSADLLARGVEVHEMSGAEMAASFGGFMRDVAEDRFRHLGQMSVQRALDAAVTRSMGDGARSWGRRRSGRDIASLVAVTSARWALIEVIPATDLPVWGFMT